jgi:hypothetical protein
MSGNELESLDFRESDPVEYLDRPDGSERSKRANGLVEGVCLPMSFSPPGWSGGRWVG